MRTHYMTLCIRDNIEVTYILRDSNIEVTFEKIVNSRHYTLVMNDNGDILSNMGFSNRDIAFCRDFLLRNIEVMYQEVRG